MKDKNYWTEEKCAEEALKYTNRSDFKLKSPSAYQKSLLKGWLNTVCAHMKQKIKPSNYWTLEKCKEEALKYKSKFEFQKNSISAYDAARNNGWLNDICSHMEIVGSLYKRCIYVFEFSDKFAYVGLTYNSKLRETQHYLNSKGPVKMHKDATGITPIFKVLSDYLELKDAVELESYFINHYKIDGWALLNKVKAGGLGAVAKKWTKETCAEEALKYKSRGEFKKYSEVAYGISTKYGWLNDICAHMLSIRQKWTKDLCYAEYIKYKNNFVKGSKSAYEVSRKNGWLEEFKEMAQKNSSNESQNYFNYNFIKKLPNE
jgi:hypothetical protein